MQLKILSWNIWINGHFDEVKFFLKNADADIIGLQEVQADDPKMETIGFLTELGYEHVFASVPKIGDPKKGERNVNDGPAVFSRHGILNSETYTLSKTDSRCAVRADVQIGDKTLHVFSAHLLHTHQKQSDVQDEQVESLLRLLPHERTILMGDFNAIPESSVIQKMGSTLTNTDPSFKPTWSAYPEGCSECLPQSMDIRLDYIFTTTDLETHSPEVGDSKGSDHLPISVMVEV